MEWKGKRRAVLFKCAAPGCKISVRRFTDKGDATSTSNLRTHIRQCKKWGEDVLTEIATVKDVDEARPMVESFARTGTITKMFKRLGKGKISFSTRQHTSHEARYVNIAMVDVLLLNIPAVRRSCVGFARVNGPSQSSAIGGSRR